MANGNKRQAGGKFGPRDNDGGGGGDELSAASISHLDPVGQADAPEAAPHRVIAVVGITSIAVIGLVLWMAWKPSTGLSFGWVPLGGDGGGGKPSGDGGDAPEGDGGDAPEGDGGDAPEGDGGDAPAEGDGGGGGACVPCEKTEDCAMDEECYVGVNGKGCCAPKEDGESQDPGEGGDDEACPKFKIPDNVADEAFSYVTGLMPMKALSDDPYFSDVSVADGMRQYYADVALEYAARSLNEALPQGACEWVEPTQIALNDRVEKAYDEMFGLPLPEEDTP